MKKSFIQKHLISVSILLIAFGSLYFTGCSGCSSSSSDSDDLSTRTGAVETPQLVPLPDVTSNSSIIVRGRTSGGAGIIVRRGASETKIEADSDSGAFEVSVELASGENTLLVYAELNGAESDPAEEVIIRTDSQALSLDSIDPGTGRSGSILALSGSGFIPDRNKMGVYFTGGLQEAEGYVLEAGETSLKVVVPFVFFNTEDIVEVYVYSKNNMSNTIDFQVSQSTDPTPGDSGNEMSEQFDLLLLQTDRAFSKMDQLVKPYVGDDTWEDLEENFSRLKKFIEDGRAEMISTNDSEALSNLDAFFSGDVFLLINEKLEEINDILNHSTNGEAACAVGEIQSILGDIINILEWVEGALIAGEVICVFVCQGALPVLELAREIVSAVLDVLQAVHAVLGAAVPSNADPSSWRIEVEGPYPGTDPHLMYTEKEYNIQLYVDFTNGGANEVIGEISFLGGVLLDLLDINLGEITMEEVLVPSTIMLHPDSPGNLLEIVNQGVPQDIHTITTFPPVNNENPFQGSVEIDIQASCGPYEYPDKICIGAGCLDPDLPEYPEFFNIDVIDAPIIEGVHGSDSRDGWLVTGLGFSVQCGTVFKIYWNGEEVPCDCIEGLDYDSFYFKEVCGIYHDPGRLSLAIVDSETGEENTGQTINVPPTSFTSVEITTVRPSSGFIGDELNVVGDHFSPYLEDIFLSFYVNDKKIVTIHPIEVIIRSPYLGDPVWDDTLKFNIPEELHGFESQTICLVLSIETGSDTSNFGDYEDEAEFELMFSEGAGWGDQDLITFESAGAYMRTAAIDDIDGDGENDLIVSVPEFKIIWGGTGEEQIVGAVFIAFGPVNGTPILTGQEYIDFSKIGIMGELRENWNVIIRGDFRDKENDYTRRLGNALATGDVNGDGISDLLIGTTDQNDLDQHTYNTSPGPGTYHLPGKAYLFYGRARSGWEQDNGIWPLSLGYEDILIHGDDERELGYAVAVGNLNSDSYADMIISAPTDSVYPATPNNLVAKTYVIFGGDSLPPDIDVANVPAGINGAVFTGEDAFQEPLEGENYKGSGLGKSIAVGDVDGDGTDDLILGAPQFIRPYDGYGRQGAAYILYGGSAIAGTLTLGLWGGNQDAIIIGPTVLSAENGSIGKPIIIGDLNNDNKSEIIFGASNTKLDYIMYQTDTNPIIHFEEDNIGRVYVVKGDENHFEGRLGIEDHASLIVNGSTTISMFGTSLAIADVNGDDINDLLVGSPGGSEFMQPGHVWGLYGSESPETLTGTIQLQDRSGDPDDFLFIGDSPRPWYTNQGFGTFVAAGDLSPYIGDDVLIINPLAHSPDPPDYPALREYAGMLHVFYHGSKKLRVIGPIDINAGDQVSGVIDVDDEDDAYQWDCLTEEHVLIDVNETDGNENVVNLNPVSVRSALFDDHDMMVAEGTGDWEIELPLSTRACGIILSTEGSATIHYQFTVNIESEDQLSISPSEFTMNGRCDVEAPPFIASGGTPPYQFSVANPPAAVQFRDNEDGTADLWLEGCVDEGLELLLITVEDSAENTANTSLYFPEPPPG